ncbi:hypothetical protein CEXT_503871 [Caerostris extrusa]|uniref:Uncharacterized protein n=1 Tax=Caerostris extrusa TaxID=172846 RepID=A0AAV4VW62_CAEEX|nr:hypothetical protein CEXT_503871 [Caerostris extrusa]
MRLLNDRDFKLTENLIGTETLNGQPSNQPLTVLASFLCLNVSKSPAFQVPLWASEVGKSRLLSAVVDELPQTDSYRRDFVEDGKVGEEKVFRSEVAL